MSSLLSNRFSALQRAENSSIRSHHVDTVRRRGFSALQRAENSSIAARELVWRDSRSFQCSSASRKFLNAMFCASELLYFLFQCSSASRKFLNDCGNIRQNRVIVVSVLFSEPKIPQSVTAMPAPGLRRTFQCSSASRKFLNFLPLRRGLACYPVSVLFSEPKIPQSRKSPFSRSFRESFSALQRAENSSI